MAFANCDLEGLRSFQRLQWSYFDDLSAVIPTDNMVHFFDSHGSECFKGSLKRGCRATQISWSPTSRVLAVGWLDGAVSLWSETAVKESQPLLGSAVVVLEWHPTLPILISASDNGRVCCWDCSAMILPLFRGQAENVQFTHAVWIPRENPFCFLISSEGQLFGCENHEKAVAEIGTVAKPVHVFASSRSTRRLIVISGDNMLTQFSFPPSPQQHSQVKLPAGNPPCYCGIRSDVLAYSIGDSVFVWNVQSDETHILRVPAGQRVTGLFFSSQKAELFATTAEGSIVSWKCTMKGLINRLGWGVPRASDIGVRIESAVWSPANLCFVAACTQRRPLVFRQLLLGALVSPEGIVWQASPDQIMVAGQAPLKVGSPIERARLSGASLLIVCQTQAEVMVVRPAGIQPAVRLTPGTTLVDISGDKIFDVKDSSLECRNLQGIVSKTTNLGHSIGHFLELNGKFLVVICTDLNVFLYDISRRDPKILFTTVFATTYECYRIRSVSVSAGGFAISVAIDIYEEGQWRPAPDLFLHSPQFDKTVGILFEGRAPVCHRWDAEDSRLLCIQTVPFGSSYESSMSGCVIQPLFVADTLEVYKQTTLQIEDDKVLCAVNLPRVFYHPTRAGITEPPQSAVLPQFEGYDHADEGSKKALMELNFHLATGDIDAAFNAIRAIDNKAIWRSLAQMCATSRRIDLVDLCFGRMEDGGSAVLLHHTKALDPDETAAIAVVDCQLGLYDEAKKVTKDNRRFDLLANIHLSLGEWTEAMNVVSASDRIHLKVLAHQNARSLEIRGNVAEAILKYEKAGTIQFELPRLAIQAGDLRLFFNYISERNSSEVHPRLHLWAGRFYEAHRQTDQALQYFESAGAHREIVRLNCCLGRWEEAAKIVKRSNKRSVICFYARMVIRRIDFYSRPENAKPQIDVEKLKHDVVELFRRARQFAQAMDFALQHEMVDDILALSFSAPPTLVCKAARWFEEQKEAKNAILLYSRAGRLNRALALCFTMKQYDALDEISDTLNGKTDPNVLIRCGRYFVESQRWSKAAQCFALARQFDDVIDLCNKHNIKLPSSVIQELSDMKADPEVMKRFAALCEQQGAYQAAASLYVKFKDHIAAMKALIRSGETDKVLKFAHLVKKKETYILAGNYLQTLNPRDGDSTFDNVVALYKKAGANDKLGRFYEAMARVEIDEYQEYAKALSLIKRGLQLVADAPDIKQKDQVVAQMQKKIRLIEMYLEAQASVKTDPKKTIQTAVEILRNPLVEGVMRTDDVYVLMVQASVAQGNFKNAYKILEDLRKNGTDISWFMDAESIQRIYREVGQTYVPPTKGAEEDEYDVVDDEALDDVDAD
jgi:intraflagellar transport protein 140